MQLCPPKLDHGSEGRLQTRLCSAGSLLAASNPHASFFTMVSRFYYRILLTIAVKQQLTRLDYKTIILIEYTANTLQNPTAKQLTTNTQLIQNECTVINRQQLTLQGLTCVLKMVLLTTVTKATCCLVTR